MTTGWKLELPCRQALLAQHPPRYVRTVADHITLGSNRQGCDGEALPEAVAMARIVGRADDGRGVEAMVVEIDGSTRRPDGGTWHVTWSLAQNREAKESNDVIAERGWVPLDGGALTLRPARW